MRVRKAATEDLPAVTEILARAFDNDPWVDWMVLDDHKRSYRVHELMAWFVRNAVPHDQIFMSSSGEGALLLMPPGAWNLGILQQLALLVTDLPRATGFRQLLSRALGIQALEEKHPEEPHYYLPLVGTDPDYQGQGIGSALLREALQILDGEGLPVYLENTNDRNLPLYERHGFELREVFEFPGQGPKMWLMWREPAPVERGLA